MCVTMNHKMVQLERPNTPLQTITNSIPVGDYIFRSDIENTDLKARRPNRHNPVSWKCWQLRKMIQK